MLEGLPIMPSSRLLISLFLVLGFACSHERRTCLDPHTTVLPMYQLPTSFALNGKLEPWARVPVSDERIILCSAETQVTTVAPSDNFAATMRCGRMPGSPDLYFLIVVKDDLLLSPGDGWWVDPDYVGLYLDFARARRAAENPKWYTNAYHYPPEMGQFGFRPWTMGCEPKAYVNRHVKDWKVEYACVPVEGGVAYEIRVDSKSVLDSLKMSELPPLLGIDVGFGDKDCPVTLQVKDWSNAEVYYRFFGDFISHVTPVKYGGLSTQPLPLPRGHAAPIKTLAELYGTHPTERQVLRGIKSLPDSKLADQLRWAVMQGMPLRADLVSALFAAHVPYTQETCLLGLYYHRDAEAVRRALAATYAHPEQALPRALTLANLLNVEMNLNMRDALPALLTHED